MAILQPCTALQLNTKKVIILAALLIFVLFIFLKQTVCLEQTYSIQNFKGAIKSLKYNILPNSDNQLNIYGSNCILTK